MTDANRLEAFSDGVMAIAITLLVLDLRVPEPSGDSSLFSALAHSWPSYLAYVVSFLVIGIIWVNHHAMFSKVRAIDRWVLFANLLLLLVVAAIPFPTKLLAEYLTADGSEAHQAAAVYSATMLFMGAAFAGLWLTVTRSNRLLHQPMPVEERRTTLRRFGAGGVVYGATIGLSFVNAVATLAVHGVIAIYYCFDQLRTPPAPPTTTST